MTAATLLVSDSPVPLKALRQAYFESVNVDIDQVVWQRVEKASQAVRDIVAKGNAVYGINTGFGVLAHTRIADDQLSKLQHNLVLSHSAGVGELLDEPSVRLIIVLKILSLAQGHSGVRREVIERLIALLNHDVIPCIPAKGSVGASGDLAPLAHLACALIGAGDVMQAGVRTPALEALRACKLEPLQLEPKEGLALLNGTQVSTALALAGLFKAENLFAAAVVCGALSVDALQGSVTPFDPRIHALRRQPGQIAVAAQLRRLLKDSGILKSHVGCEKVQDPYSVRCQPQVMGACLDLMHNAGRTLELEANAVTDNPLVFPDTHEALSGGNFHAEPVAIAADTLALAIAEVASISERRMALLIDPHMNGGLPAFLVEDSGLNSGFMLAQVTAAALVSENKTLAHPACVDSIPTSANQEDHVSMATFAGRRLGDMAENSANVVAIELLAAVQGVEYRAPHKTSALLAEAVTELRRTVPPYTADRFFSPDIASAAGLIEAGWFYRFVSEVLPTGSAP